MAALTIKGAPATNAQKNAAKFLLGVCKEQQTDQLVQQAIIFAAIMESDMGVALGPNSGGYGGILAGQMSYFSKFGGVSSQGSQSSPGVWYQQALCFIQGGHGFQSATALEGKFQGKPGLLAAAVEQPDLPGDSLGADGYGQYSQPPSSIQDVNTALGEAAQWVAAYGSGGITGGTAGSSTGTKANNTAPFYIGGAANPNEDVWTGINRLAQERYWYLFSDGETLYLADGSILVTQQPAITLDRWINADRIVSLSFTWDNPLALDTLIPTPTGWTTMGEVQTGDYVFGSDGKPTRVLGGSPVFLDRECFRVHFDDHTSFVADASHQWQTVTKKIGPAASSVKKLKHQRWIADRTTAQIRDSLYVSSGRHGQRLNHQVLLADALDLPDQDLLIDPYILGYWLGDGGTGDNSIGVSESDRRDLEHELTRAGYSFIKELQTKKNKLGRQDFWKMKFSTFSEYRRASRGEDAICLRLKTLGVFHDKHVPSIYLRSSSQQRLALLQGLMDSDGCVSGNECDFSAVAWRHDLIGDVLELVASLGFKPYLRYKKERGISKPQLHVCFTTRPHLNPFRLRRKAVNYEAQVRGKKYQDGGAHARTIIAVEPVESVPVRCIAVAADDHVFLIGKSFTRTRNTAFEFIQNHQKRRRVQRRTSLAKVSSPVEAELDVICNIDDVRAGDVVELSGCGPGDGRWIVGDCRRSVFKIYSELTLVPAIQSISEQQYQAGLGATSNADIPGAAAGAPGAGTLIAALDSAATTINNQGLPFVSYGGRAIAGTPDPGKAGESIPGGGTGFFNGFTSGYDSAGAVAAVLAAAALISGPVPDPSGIISKLTNNKQFGGAQLLVPGRGGGVPEFSLFLGGGYFFVFINATGVGSYWGTGDGGGVATASNPVTSTPANAKNTAANSQLLAPSTFTRKYGPNALSGGTWLNPPPSLKGFQTWHIPQNLLGDLLGNAGVSGALAGTYHNPLAKATNIVTRRIDQGVDYSMTVGNPILALGDAQIGIATNNSPGWYGGLVTYTLSNGPYEGKSIYVAEGITTTVTPASNVSAGSTIGTYVGGQTGMIETGWWDEGTGFSMAHTYGQFNGGNSTMFGGSFNHLLTSLGAPSGINQGGNSMGRPLPPGYPSPSYS